MGDIDVKISRDTAERIEKLGFEINRFVVEAVKEKLNAS